MILILLFISTLIGCQPEKTDPILFSGDAMTMPYRILVGEKLNTSQKDKIHKIILNTFSEINAIYNKWNPESEISRLNQSPKKQPIPLSQELEKFLLRTDKLVTLSEGRFDPTIEKAQKLWKKYLNQGKIPKDDEITRASNAVGWNKIHIQNGFFQKECDDVELDLGGIAKGYGIDLMVEKLKLAGYHSLYVEWGGEIRTLGNHPEGRSWRIAISKLGSQDLSSALAIVEMHDQSIASSGDYLQNWTADNTIYFHIINPKTCRPLIIGPGTICSATVITDDCMTADCLATIAMMFDSAPEAEKWLENLKNEVPDLRYWISTR